MSCMVIQVPGESTINFELMHLYKLSWINCIAITAKVVGELIMQQNRQDIQHSIQIKPSYIVDEAE